MPEQSYYTHLAAAFVRGKLGLEAAADDALIRLGAQRGLRLHKFKQTSFPRVLKVLGILAGLQPASLLDRFPGLRVRALDVLPRRVDDINAVKAGGIDWVEATLADAAAMAEPAGAYDVVTTLEVLEHMEESAPACRAIVAAAQRFVVASVPSKPDDNPEHI